VSEKMEDTLLYGPEYHVTSTHNEIDEDYISRLKRECDSLKRQLAHYEELHKNIRRWLEVEMPALKSDCEDCDQEEEDCFKCPHLLETLWVLDDIYRESKCSKEPR
jgi:hypothetical protein